VESIIAALEYSGNECLFNISDPSIYDLNDIIGILKSKGLSFDVDHQPSDESNGLQILSEDISKAKNDLMWEPSVNLEKGLGLVMQEIGFNS
jgi:nucleoside-diphosphate-sugar epimerase